MSSVEHTFYRFLGIQIQIKSPNQKKILKKDWMIYCLILTTVMIREGQEEVRKRKKDKIHAVNLPHIH